MGDLLQLSTMFSLKRTTNYLINKCFLSISNLKQFVFSYNIQFDLTQMNSMHCNGGLSTLKPHSVNDFSLTFCIRIYKINKKIKNAVELI